MKTLIGLSLAVSALLGPALSFAQTSNTPLTRAEVYADLVRVEHAGYNPSVSDDSTYPADIQAAEAKIAAQDAVPVATASTDAQPAAAVTTGEGAAMTGSSASGMREPMKSKTHDNECVGPVDYCTPFFGS